MVYNAMKLFMEINPQLFDDCSHEYTELQMTAAQRNQNRQSKWDRLNAQAEQMKSGLAGASSRASGGKSEADPTARDNQERLDALKLHDESSMTGKSATVSG